MNELDKILILHAACYPKMQPTDAVKLIFQNEFGGGHLIRDEAACLAYLRREYASVPKDPAAPRYEDIGNGLIRIPLAVVTGEELDRLGKAFLRSAAAHQGSLSSFLEKLEVLRRLTGEGCFSFNGEELGEYLAAYEAAGYPAVSHSKEYRDAYHPSYRIVRETEYPFVFKEQSSESSR